MSNEIAMISKPAAQGVRMRRDMELIRKILIAIEEKDDLELREISIPDEDETLTAAHLNALFDAGMIDGVKQEFLSRGFPIVLVRDLTWEGHDLLAGMRAGNVWEKVKSAFSPSELAALPLPVIKDILVKAIAKWALDRLGL